ncbi:MAG: hypothetical protein WC600_02805 [Desulfobaccales bacterium]
MENKKEFFFVVLILFAIVTVLTFLPASAQGKRYPKFDVCIANETNIPVNYRYRWCTRAGKGCRDYKKTTIRPGSTNTHTSPEGMARLDVEMHTGGAKGYYKTYSIEGETEGCKLQYAIGTVEGGHLRIFKK